MNELLMVHAKWLMIDSIGISIFDRNREMKLSGKDRGGTPQQSDSDARSIADSLLGRPKINIKNIQK